MVRQIDLFSPVERRDCARCGSAFTEPCGEPGRPRAFCSDACRHAQAQQQRNAWAKVNKRIKPDNPRS